MLASQTDHLHTALSSADTPRSIVVQPSRVQLEAFFLELGSIAENVQEESSNDLGASSGTTGGGASQSQDPSPRERAIAKLPPPATMQRKLQHHIEREIKRLNSQAKRITRISKPGSAHRLNALYARIRMLHELMRELWEASLEVLRRLFIRVFIDRQPIG